MSRLDRLNSFKSILQEINTFFRSPKWHEVLVFLFFLILSLSFWYLQNLKRDFDIELVMPITYVNIPEDITPHGEMPDSMTIHVKDKGTVLIHYIFLRRFEPIVLDVKELRKGRATHLLISEAFLKAQVTKQIKKLTDNAKLNINPSEINLEFRPLKSEVFTVEPLLEVNLMQGFHLSDQFTVDPDTVRVYGSQEVLDSIKVLTTEPQTIENANMLQTIKMQLAPIAGARFTQNEVTVVIPVEEFTEKRLRIPIKCDSIPEGVQLRLFPSEVEVVCNIPLSRYKELTEDDLEISYPFQMFVEHQLEGKLTLTLTKSSRWIIQPKISPETVEFILEKNTP